MTDFDCRTVTEMGWLSKGYRQIAEVERDEQRQLAIHAFIYACIAVMAIALPLGVIYVLA